jgi:glycine oxidase
MRSSAGPSARPDSFLSDVAVLGGGVIGLSIAWILAREGVSVALVDPAAGKGASWAAAGMLAPVTEVHPGEEELLKLNLAAAARYPEFVAAVEEASGTDVGYRRAGTVIVARDSDDNAALEDVFRYQVGLGLEVERLSGREVRHLEPALSPRTRGGIHVPGDHQIDNRALVSALLQACKRAEVAFVRRRARGIRPSGESIHVELEDGGAVDAGRAVLAAGAATATIEGLERAALPAVRPVKGQLLHLRGPEPSVRGNVRGLDVYLVGRADGRVVVGATVEEQGFDLRTTAGAVHDLLRAAYELVPGITELELVETTAGSRPATADNAPLIGRTSWDPVYVATGHFRNGVLLAPVTADAIARLVLQDELDEAVAPFSPVGTSGEGSMG